jgi:hypothetical protein
MRMNKQEKLIWNKLKNEYADNTEVLDVLCGGENAREKQIPKKPIEEEKQYSEDYGFNSDILCPVCNNYIGYYTEAMSKPEYMKYCNECGQRIDDDWSGEDE